MKKSIISLLIGIFAISNVVFAQPGEDTVYHYYKATVPFRTEDLQDVSAYSFIGQELNSDSYIHTTLSFDGDDRDWVAEFNIGAIKTTGDERYRDVICVFKQKFVREKFGPHIVGVIDRRWQMGHSHLSCNHNRSKDEDVAILDEDYCDFEEITEEEYYSYIPRNGVKKQDNNINIKSEVLYNNLSATSFDEDSNLISFVTLISNEYTNSDISYDSINNTNDVLNANINFTNKSGINKIFCNTFVLNNGTLTWYRYTVNEGDTDSIETAYEQIISNI